MWSCLGREPSRIKIRPCEGGCWGKHGTQLMNVQRTKQTNPLKYSEHLVQHRLTEPRSALQPHGKVKVWGPGCWTLNNPEKQSSTWPDAGSWTLDLGQHLQQRSLHLYLFLCFVWSFQYLLIYVMRWSWPDLSQKPWTQSAIIKLLYLHIYYERCCLMWQKHREL